MTIRSSFDSSLDGAGGHAGNNVFLAKKIDDDDWCAGKHDIGADRIPNRNGTDPTTGGLIPKYFIAD